MINQLFAIGELDNKLILFFLSHRTLDGEIVHDTWVDFPKYVNNKPYILTIRFFINLYFFDTPLIKTWVCIFL